MNQNACHGIHVRDVMNHALISPTSLKRRFRAVLGQSIHYGIVTEQIKRVQQLLAESSMPLKEIARQAGFPSQNYMGVVFKTRTGQTPGQYRGASRLR